MNNLTELANQYDSDKGTTGGRKPHKYTYIYDLLFYPYKDKEISFLEIGLCRGGPELGGDINRKADSPSVRMWKDYFPKAQLTGFDISDFSHQEDESFKFVRGDSGKEEDMQKLTKVRSHYDLILEDASHASYHQQMAFKVLYSKLSEGGLFIIEDLNWQPPVFEDNLPKVPKTTEFFMNFFEKGEYIDNVLLTKDFMESIKPEVQSVSFFPDFNAFSSTKIKLMVLQKKRSQNT